MCRDPWIFLFTLWSVLLMVRMNAVKSDLYWIHWIVPVGLKRSKSFWNSQLCFPRLSLCQAIWQRWDALWKGHGQGRQSKDVFQHTLLLCIVHALHSCLVIIWHFHTLSGDKVTPLSCGWRGCNKTGSSTHKKSQHGHTSSRWFVCLYDSNLGMWGLWLSGRPKPGSSRHLVYDSISSSFPGSPNKRINLCLFWEEY